MHAKKQFWKQLKILIAEKKWYFGWFNWEFDLKIWKRGRMLRPISTVVWKLEAMYSSGNTFFVSCRTEQNQRFFMFEFNILLLKLIFFVLVIRISKVRFTASRLRVEFTASNVAMEYGFICNHHNIAKIVDSQCILYVLIT